MNRRVFFGCGARGKISYSKSDALLTVKRLRAIGSDADDSLNAYRCADCGRWHVGHSRYRGAQVPGTCQPPSTGAQDA